MPAATLLLLPPAWMDPPAASAPRPRVKRAKGDRIRRHVQLSLLVRLPTGQDFTYRELRGAQAAQRPRTLQLLPPLAAAAAHPPCGTCPRHAVCKALCPEMLGELSPSDRRLLAKDEIPFLAQAIGARSIGMRDPHDIDDDTGRPTHGTVGMEPDVDNEHLLALIRQAEADNAQRAQLDRAIATLTASQRSLIHAFLAGDNLTTIAKNRLGRRKKGEARRRRGVSKPTISIMFRRAVERLRLSMTAAA